MSEIIKGYITSYIYKSEDSLYKVARIKSSEKEIVITGSFLELEEGLEYEFIGDYIVHERFGRQFKIQSYSKTNSYTEKGLIQYLSSDKFYGIGVRLATKIVEILGIDLIDQIIDDPDCLDVVPKLSKEKKQVIIEVIKNNYATESVFIKLHSFGLTPKMINRLFEVYGLESAIRIEENPYSLIYDIEGFGFKKSDVLALSLGFKENDILRLKEAIKYTLNTVCYQYGFTFLTKEQLLNSAFGLLNNSDILMEELDNALSILIEDELIIKEDDRYFDSWLYKCEIDASSRLKKIKEKSIKLPKEDKIKENLLEVEKDLNIKYTDLQVEAIVKALTNKLTIITGGPGTGKSTIIDGIIKTYAKINDITFPSDELDYRVCMMAPTGRAAKRMVEITNFKAKTIHKTLGYTYEGEFQYNKDNHLPFSLYIIDESSMIDIHLISSLLKAMPLKSQIIFVGDENQLPSVGPGNVFHDFIASKLFVTIRLHEIMRQAKDSNIIKLSNMVLNGKIDYRIFSERNQVYFYNCEAKNFKELLFKLVDAYLKNDVNDLKNGLQILIPMYAGIVGIDEINNEISNRYNKNEEMLVREDIVIKTDDKVLQLKNEPTLGIMNGDIGIIRGITTKKNKDVLLIDFDGLMVEYPAKDIDNLKLAYAISIHKSQGNEYDNVIIPIFSSYFKMLRKKIIYTAITRTKKKLIMVGSIDVLNNAINTKEEIRQTGLLNRLLDTTHTYMKINDPTIGFEELKEYDMDDITPYSFM